MPTGTKQCVLVALGNDKVIKQIKLDTILIDVILSLFFRLCRQIHVGYRDCKEPQNLQEVASHEMTLYLGFVIRYTQDIVRSPRIYRKSLIGFNEVISYYFFLNRIIIKIIKWRSTTRYIKKSFEESFIRLAQGFTLNFKKKYPISSLYNIYNRKLVAECHI